MSDESVQAALDKADRVLAGGKPNLVKVQYYSTTTGERSDREYTYYSIDKLAVGDIVSLPVRNTITKAKVSAINVPESEIASFKDKVKTIPVGSVEAAKLVSAIERAPHIVDETEQFLKGVDTKIHLCDTCTKFKELFPKCEGDDALFGDGYGSDNVYKCGNYVNGTTDDLFTAETSIALRPGEDIEVHGYFEEAVKFSEYAERRVIATVEDVKLANADLSKISKLKKVMENKRKSLLDPLKSQSDAIRETYDYLMAPIRLADGLTREKMLAYSAEQDRIRKEQEEINALRMEAAQRDATLHNGEISEPVNLVEVVPEISKTVSAGTGSSSQRDNWQYEVVDVDALPREYMIPDLVMLNAIAKKYHDKKNIAGVRFYNKPIIANRAK